MKVHLVGVQPLDFEGRDGAPIKGFSLQVNYSDDNTYGVKADTKFLSDVSCKNFGITLDTLLPLVEHDVDLELNFKGKVVGINPVSEEES